LDLNAKRVDKATLPKSALDVLEQLGIQLLPAKAGAFVFAADALKEFL
jgi:hypothetical protein